ncbi:DNA-binding transcriptional LysR family regulator [Rhizobium leguminosarum]|uniref:LysR family transcriptional regulator n=1 Tax=Rhizobium leguminosarum TaxID=384 RepID=UPI0024B336C6|nr:LysR family transcriptional regulator [Rhizobium leguminosarum]WHO82630.1 LysR family transcriptional regulator [Rhizobium leguminosarum]
MDFKQLSYFAAIIEQSGFRNAARVLGVSQPALSKAISKLEKDLGVSLIERNNAGITATTFGNVLYSYARSMRDEINFAKQMVTERGRREDGVIVLGTLPSLASTIIPLALGRWMLNENAVEVRVVERVQAELLISLMKGELDFVIGQTQYYDNVEGLRQRVLFRDVVKVFARSEHPLFQKPEIEWADLVVFPWVSPTSGRYRTTLESVLESQGLKAPRRTTRSSSVEFARTIVLNSDHLVLMPPHAFAFDVRAGRMKALPLLVPHSDRGIALIFHERSPLRVEWHDLIELVEVIGHEMSEI